MHCLFRKLKPSKWRLLMTIKTEVDQILAVVNAQTETLSALTAAVAAIPSGTVPPELQVSLDKLNTAVADIQTQVEDPAPVA